MRPSTDGPARVLGLWPPDSPDGTKLSIPTESLCDPLWNATITSRALAAAKFDCF